MRENEKVHGAQYPNMTFQALDATKIDFPANTFDFVTYVWLMLYLNDKEVETFVVDLMKLVSYNSQHVWMENNYCNLLYFSFDIFFRQASE